LRSKSGTTADAIAQPDDGEFVNTELFYKCVYIQEIADTLGLDLHSVRLMQLAPGSEITTHRDQGLSYKYGYFRLHIPILTSGDVDFIVNKVKIDMKLGECWYADFDLPHSVVNRSVYPRVHLVIDGARNSRSDELFAAAGFDINTSDKQVFDRNTARMIRKELVLRGNKVALEKFDSEYGQLF
jgi:hypothetical protein